VRTRWWTAVVVGAGCASLATGAAATPVPIQGMRAEIDASWRHGQLFDTLGQDCINISTVRWGSANTQADYRKRVLHYVEPQTAATGSYDGIAHVGSAHDSLTAFNLSRSVAPFKTLNVNDVGVEIAGGHAYLTAAISRGAPLFSTARRIRLAVVAHPKLIAGPATDFRHPDRQIPNSFLFAIQGPATVTPALSRLIKHFGCTKRVGVLRPRAVKPGSRFGFLTFQLQPTAAVGLGGTVDLGPQFENDEAADVTVLPVTPATSAPHGVRLQLPGGNQAPLACQFGVQCAPTAGAKLGTAGGFTVSYGDRSVAVDQIEAAYVASAPGEPARGGLTAAVGGERMTIAQPGLGAASASDEFLAALSDRLGLRFTSGSFDLSPSFTALGPL
jgi:hypothetical protein